jgi:putative photosynthetic complex assembly protein 2
MQEYIAPIVFTLFLWWFSTGVILYLDGLPRHTYRLSFYAFTVLLGDAFVGLWFSRYNTTISAAYVAFTCAILVWAWVEVAFLMGFVTGSRKSACPLHARGWHKAWLAFQAIWHHELALLVLGLVIYALTQGAPNQIGMCAYGTLYVMRLSAKLNVFLGVRNLNEHFLPEHLRYLGSYFTRKWMNPLFPVTVSVASIATAAVWHSALTAGVSDFHAAAYSFIGTLLALAVLEHWFLVLPIPIEWLWKWGFYSRDEQPLQQSAV